MNKLSRDLMKKANYEAVFNTYLYLSDKSLPYGNEPFYSIISNLEKAYINEKPLPWKNRDVYRLNILKNAVAESTFLSNSKLGELTFSKSGLTSCYFNKPDAGISFVFKGTGDGEWIDNGEGLSGIPEENTYIKYDKNGKAERIITLKNDYATDQQAEALNWFNKKAAENGWDFNTSITVSGHSKGGNKAQFVKVNSDIVNLCFSFDGQGFSPEALNSFKKRLGYIYEKRRKSIFSLSSCNDYVNVLGKRLVSDENIYFFESHRGIHQIDAILNKKGQLRPECQQGTLSLHLETFSDEIMNMPPSLRQYATLGIMNIFQKYLGEGEPVNGDNVSIKKTAAGITIAVGSLLYRLKNM